METSSAYTQHRKLMQNYDIGDGRKQYQAPYAEAFEKIYEEADEADVNLSNAKAFLSSLDHGELRTVQKYNGLVEAIDVGAISAEGAYNLLMHDNEQFDFDNDGIMEVGAGRSLMPVPRNMPSDVKAAYIETLNSLEGREKLMAMTLSFDVGRIKSILNNTPYTPPTIDYDYLQNRVNEILNPTGGGFSSEEFKAIIQKFWDTFQSAFDGSQERAAEVATRDQAVEEFLEKLRELGAGRFLAEFNQEKIDEEVEKYRAELIKNMDATSQTMEDIEKLVSDFKKELLEKLHLISEQEKAMKSADYFEIRSSLFEGHEKGEKDPLELLLLQIRGMSSIELQNL
jgi:hypothetical protein